MSDKKQTMMFESRGEAMGIKPTKMVSKALKTVDQVRAKLEPLSIPFSDIDSSVDSALVELLDAIDKFKLQLNQSLEWLNEPFDA